MRKLIWVVLLALLLPTANFAQRLTGSASLQVLDPSGAAVAGVKAAVTSVEKGTSLGEYTAGADGVVLLPDLPPGTYKVSLQHAGFKTTIVAITIRVGVTTSLEIKMQLGALTGTVLVEATAETVDTEKSAVQGVVQANEIESLPLNGRNFLDLAQLAPGVQVLDGGMFDPTKNQMTGVSVAGRSGRSTRIQVDGVDITDETVGTTVMNLTNESIQEFGVAQSSLDVSTDLTSSGAVNIITKSGGNAIHGSGFGFFRRSDFAASTAPLGTALPKAPFSRDNYGGEIGGPFIKNKWFWEAEYEKLQQVGANTTSVPEFPQFTGSFSVPMNEHMGGARTDFNLTNSQKLFYRFNHDDNLGVTGFGGVGLSAFGNKNQANSHVVGWDYTKGNGVHSIRFSFLKFVNGILDANALAGTPILPVQVNITGLGGFLIGPSDDAPQSTLQENRQTKYDGTQIIGHHTLKFGVEYNRIAEGGFASFFGLGPRARASYPVGPNTVDPYNANGAADPLNFQFNSVYFGNDLGYGSEKPALGRPHGGFYNNRIGIYLHDTWMVKKTFTLNAGLRYDRDDGLTNHDLARDPLIGTFDPELAGRPRIPSLNLAPQAGFAWNLGGNSKTVIRGGGGIYYDTNIFNNLLFDRALNLVPGLGNAYPFISGSLPLLPSPLDSSVALFDINNSCTGAQPHASNPNSCIGAAIGNVIPFLVAAQSAYQAASRTLSATWPTPGIPVEFESDLGTDTIGGSLLDPKYKSPYGEQLNIGIQREIKPGLVLSVDYIMNRGVHLNVMQDRNRLGAADSLNVAAAQTAIAKTLTACGVATIDQSLVNCPSFQDPHHLEILVPATMSDYAGNGVGKGSGVDGFAFSGKNPNFRQMLVIEPVGVSRYQGLQTRLSGKLGTWGPFKNVATTMSYTYSHFNSTGGNNETDLDFLTTAEDNDFPNRYYGPSNMDRRHQLGFSFIMDLPAHFRFSTTTLYRSPVSSDILLSDNTGGGPDGIFYTDLNGDGTVGDPLPGTNHGSFDRGINASNLNNVINKYNSTVAGGLTPAGHALVAAGLFTQAQLVALGAVADSAPPADATQINNPNFYTTDIRFSWRYKLNLGDHSLTIEPMAECFNIFNRMNSVGSSTIGTNAGLSGILSGGPGTINGTDAQFQRVGQGSGSFSSGVPRAFQFGIRVSL